MNRDDLTTSRREFLGLASGLLIIFPVQAQEPTRLPSGRSGGYPSDFNAYLHIAPDNTVTGYAGKVELGQGSTTALAQLLAEELDASFDAVKMVMGDTDVCPWDMGTFGSLTIRQFGPVFRGAAAEARAVLLAMASERLGAPVESLTVKDGVVSNGNGKTVTYGQLVEGKRIERHLANVPVKPVSSYKVVGTSPARRDAVAKVTGQGKYAADILLPGMLHARILRPPAHGATLKEADTSAAGKIDGVRVVREGDIVAVLHKHRDIADSALALVRAKWDTPQPTVDDRSIYDHLLKVSPPPRVVAENGNLDAGDKLASEIIEHTYYNAYVAHSPIETHSATARVEGGKATVWAGTQTPFPLQQQIAQALHFSPENVRVITPYVGGGFGGKSASRQAVEAAVLSKITGTPVQVVFSRAEEFFYDTFRPAAVVKVRAGLTPKGQMVLWSFDVWGAGDREAKQFYDIPNERTRSSGSWGGGNPPGLHPFAVGPWRAPSVNTNTFARESHIDIAAAKAGVDPVEFRMKHLSDKRMRGVLEAAAARFGWKPASGPSGRGIGVACGIYASTYVATMAQLNVDKATGHVRVERVVTAQDEGVIVSREGTLQQIEGCITMGLGYALTEGVHFRGGEVLERNFDTYELPRFSWLPKIEVVLVENPEVEAKGCGEPPIITMGAVIANAIFDATGKRLFELPMTPERIKAALG